MSISVLNTDAGLSGKTIVNLEDAQTVTGLKTFDRDPNPPFAVSSGSAVVANLDADKVDGVDIGTLAANRILYATSASAVAGSANFTYGSDVVTVTGAGSPKFRADGNTDGFPQFQLYENGVSKGILWWDSTNDIVTLGTGSTGIGFSLTPAGKCFINDTANAEMTIGLTINQGASDNEALALKSSSITHGITALAETDTYFTAKKTHGTNGGAWLSGYREDNGGAALYLSGTITSSGDTSRSTSSVGAVQLNGAEKSGTSATGMTANANVVVISTGGTTRFIFDADGDSHQDVGTAWTNFDDGDDIARLDAVAVTLAREGDPLREEFVRSFEERKEILARMPGKPLISFNEDGHHFVNMSRLAMLHNGAIRQLARQNEALQRELAGVRDELRLLRA